MLTDNERNGQRLTAVEQRQQQLSGHLRELRRCLSELERRARVLETELAELTTPAMTTQAARTETEASA